MPITSVVIHRRVTDPDIELPSYERLTGPRPKPSTSRSPITPRAAG